MRGIGMVAVVLPALVGCTSVRMLQREGCWVKQTEKWPGRVSEELGFCSKPAPVWAQDRVARLVQECMAQADFRWQNRALAAWTRGEPIPPQPGPRSAPERERWRSRVLEAEQRQDGVGARRGGQEAGARGRGDAPVVVTPRTLVKPADGCLAARKPAVRRGTASKLPADEPACPKTAQPPSPVSLGPAGGD